MSKIISKIKNAWTRYSVSRNLIIILFIVFFAICVITNITIKSEQHFSFLAKSFLQGKLYFTEMPGFAWNDDTTFYHGHYYWPLGPFPAILLLPFVFLAGIFKIFFYQGYSQVALILLIAFICFKIARRLRYSKTGAWHWVFAFCFATMLIGIIFIPWSWYFAQVIVVVLGLLSIYEYLGKKRYWLIGIFLALMLTTRLTAGLNVIFFILEIIFISQKEKNHKIKDLFYLLLPIIICLSLLMTYNYLRFNNILENGYKNQSILSQLTKAREQGILSLKHLPTNLYYFFLSGPQLVHQGDSLTIQAPFIKPNIYGMSVFITSPYFLYFFFLKYKDRLSKILIINIGAVALALFLYYGGAGYVTLGYRYALDFLPFLFWLLMKNYFEKNQELKPGMKIAIILSSLFNFYLLLVFLFRS
ncbi:MAG: hypothetical protein AAB465_03120 [Patescibacteria group bacterium]